MDRLGYDLLPVDLRYRGNQGLDGIFQHRETGSFAITEFKHGDGIGDLETYGFRQGTKDYNLSRIERYIRHGDGTHDAFAAQLFRGVELNEVQSFATFYRGGSTRYIPPTWQKGLGTFEIYFGNN